VFSGSQNRKGLDYGLGVSSSQWSCGTHPPKALPRLMPEPKTKIATGSAGGDAGDKARRSLPPDSLRQQVIELDVGMILWKQINLIGSLLYHASLDPEEYQTLLRANGFDVLALVVEDASCGNHTVWQAHHG
jgi:hypothetical protein